ncbi:MAG: ArdC-like ssDNA-binding domain-containing protein [Lapillicoccus sp.]
MNARRAVATHGGRPSRAPRDEAAQRERLEAFHQQLTDQVLALADGPSWKSWLATAAKFHHYSFNNTVAILMQRPDASQVAGYRTWQSLGRQVRKGEQGIQILAPVTRRVTVDDQAGGDRHTGTRARPGAAHEPEPAGAGPRRLVGVRIAFVFDVSQTDPIPGAPPLPTPPPVPQLLTGQAPPGLWDGLARQVEEEGFTLVMTDPGGGARGRGRTNHTTRHVEVNPDLEPAQKVKTLAHELGHTLLHTPDQIPITDLHKPNGRARVEVEAESVAFLVSAAHGLDTSSYTFPYVGGWMPRKSNLETTLRDTAARVLGTAHGILERLDRDKPDLTIPAEDRAAVPVELGPDRGPGVARPGLNGPALDGARAALRGDGHLTHNAPPGGHATISYGSPAR